MNFNLSLSNSYLAVIESGIDSPFLYLLDDEDIVEEEETASSLVRNANIIGLV